MKRVLLVCFVILFAGMGAAFAQEEPVDQEIQGITKGQFAVLLLKAAAGYTDTLPDPVDALDQDKRYGLRCAKSTDVVDEAAKVKLEPAPPPPDKDRPRVRPSRPPPGMTWPPGPSRASKLFMPGRSSCYRQ